MRSRISVWLEKHKKVLIVRMDLLVYCSNSLPSSSLQRKINALTEKPRVFLNNQEMMAAMMEGMPLRQLLSFVPGIKREILEQMVGALNEGVAYNKKNVSMEIKALCQTRN